MGRVINIELNDVSRTALENGYRHSNSHVFRVRCQMVLLKADGRKSSEVASIVKVCEQTVNKWLKRYKKDGLQGVETKSGQGRTPILDIEKDAEVVRQTVAEHRQKLSLAQVQLERSLGKKFSDKTLRRFLKNCVVDISESENVPLVRKSKRSMTTS